jgi:hypothetical protein
VTAPLVALALVRRPGFATSRVFIAWNLFGILDLVVAVTTGGLHSALAAPGEVTTGPMAMMPLVQIPAFLVPLFIMLHLVALFQARWRVSEPAEPAAAADPAGILVFRGSTPTQPARLLSLVFGVAD